MPPHVADTTAIPREPHVFHSSGCDLDTARKELLSILTVKHNNAIAPRNGTLDETTTMPLADQPCYSPACGVVGVRGFHAVYSPICRRSNDYEYVFLNTD